MNPQGDRARFEELYRATRRDVLSFLVRRAGDRERAADLLAETYLIAWRKLPQVPDGERGRLWLFGVARNLLLKEADRRRSNAVLVERLASELASGLSTGPRTDDHRACALREGLAGLPEKEREVLLLTAWEGLAPREISAVTGASPNVVRVRLSRARSKLRRQFKSRDEISLGPSAATTEFDP